MKYRISKQKMFKYETKLKVGPKPKGLACGKIQARGLPVGALLLDLGEVEDMPVKRDDPWDESAKEEERYFSFDNSSIDQKTISVITKLGFVYIGNKNMAECLYCGIVREINKGIGATHFSFFFKACMHNHNSKETVAVKVES